MHENKSSPWEDESTDDEIEWHALRSGVGRKPSGPPVAPAPVRSVPPVPHGTLAPSLPPALKFPPPPSFAPQSLNFGDEEDSPFVPVPAARRRRGWPVLVAAVVGVCSIGVVLTGYYQAEAEKKARLEKLLTEMQRIDEALARDRVAAAEAERKVLEEAPTRPNSEAPSNSTQEAPVLAAPVVAAAVPEAPAVEAPAPAARALATKARAARRPQLRKQIWVKAHETSQVATQEVRLEPLPKTRWAELPRPEAPPQRQSVEDKLKAEVLQQDSTPQQSSDPTVDPLFGL